MHACGSYAEVGDPRYLGSGSSRALKFEVFVVFSSFHVVV